MNTPSSLGISGEDNEGPATQAANESTLRSKRGCWTCRQRKVKCDEVQPRCGQCTRLDRQCDWNRRWRFISWNSQIHRAYAKNGGSSDMVALSNRKWQEMIDARPRPKATSTLPDGHRREQQALGRAPGSLNLILTPKSFEGIYDHEDNPRAPRIGVFKQTKSTLASTQPDPPSATEDQPDDPDVVMLEQFEDAPLTPKTAYYRRRKQENIIWSLSLDQEIQRDFMDYGTREGDNVKHVRLYESVISTRIMPLATRFHLNIVADGEDVIVAVAKSFTPVQHAICAITLLTLALRGKPNLLAGAFHYYDKAIAACMTCTDIDSDSFFYLHFLLLLYDISCATQSWPHDKRIWALHLEHLSRIIHNKQDSAVGQLQAYLSWYILLLDSQSCLAGNEESGSFVRAYLANGCTLPKWPLVPSPHKKFLPTDPSLFLEVHDLTLHMFTFSAKLSQVAIKTRKEAKSDTITLEQLQQRIQELCNSLQNEWLNACPDLLRSRTDMSDLPVIIRSTFEFAKLQYSVLALYLHTSIFPNQRLSSARFENEDAYHCTFILSLASTAVANRDFNNHHMVPAIFIAGFASRSDKEQALAIHLLSAMEGTGISNSVSRSRELLEIVQKEQRYKRAIGSSPEEVDWKDIAHERGAKCINFGL